MENKRCSKCKEVKPLESFNKQTRDRKDGRRSECRDCEKKYWAAKVSAKRAIGPQLVELFIWANRMDEERFTPVKDFETRFWISDFGRLVSHDHRKGTVNFLSPHIDTQGYYQPQLRKKPLTRKVRTHQLVGEHYLSKDSPTKTFINHLNGIKLDNYYKNLEYTTPGGNVRHAVEIGIFNIKGIRHPHAKLTEEEVREMRCRFLASPISYKKLGQQFGIGRRQTTDIIKRVGWKHI